MTPARRVCNSRKCIFVKATGTSAKTDRMSMPPLQQCEESQCAFWEENDCSTKPKNCNAIQQNGIGLPRVDNKAAWDQQQQNNINVTRSYLANCPTLAALNILRYLFYVAWNVSPVTE
ncbi:hypothetical protein BsWGS_10504 [Bradybaena similaris]